MLLRHFLESFFVLLADQRGNLMLRFGLTICRMVVAFVGRAVAFTAKMRNVFVSIEAFTPKKVSFLGVHAHPHPQ